jgi:hypothetical protein
VLFKVHVYSQYPLPSSDGICGVFVANMNGFTGNQVFVFSLVMSVLLMGIGIGTLMRGRAPEPSGMPTGNNTARSLFILAGLVSLGLITTTIGSYLVLVSGTLFLISLIAVISLLLGQGISL